VTDETARKEARTADEEGRCGFCASTATRYIRRRPRVIHRATCKLVTEHAGRISLCYEDGP
jgi:hypothetical protein